MAWEYDRALHQSAQAPPDTLQRVTREQGAAQWQAAVPHAVWMHGDMHPGNVILRRGVAGVEPVLLDWARARPGSALEDVSAWVQSLGHWEPQARRFHDTLVRTYLVARGLEPVLPSDFRRLY
jgi:aminoglycoside phosphotransferase (APT) family kinase protein